MQRKLKGLNCLYLNIKKEKEKERDIKLINFLNFKDQITVVYPLNQIGKS